MKFYLTAVAVLGIVSTSMVSATVVDNGVYTTDTDLGLDYLDVGLVRYDYATFEGGIVYDSRTWNLATAAQIASTWSDATGLGLTSADILSGDNDMGATASGILHDLFDGVTTDVGSGGESVIGDYGMDGYFNHISGGQLSVHGGTWNDSHYQSNTGGTASAWLVSASSVPEPSTLALLALGILGFGVTRKPRM